MERSDVSELGELDARKILGVSALTLIVVLAAGAVYAYSQVELNQQKAEFETNATILSPNQSNGALEAGIATGQGMSFGSFNALFNKTKTLNLSADDLSLVKVETRGNISSRLSYEDRHLFTGVKQIPFEMEGNGTGFYNGTIVLDMKTAENRWGERWLRLLYRFS
jgi:hypothetical protein